MKPIRLSLLLSFGVLALGSACGPTKPKCLPSNCSGCCDAKGECVSVPTQAACGLRGSSCMMCAADQLCLGGFCSGGGSNGGGTATGGGSATGGGGGATGGGGGTTGGGGGMTGGGGGSVTGGGGGSVTGGGGGSVTGGGGGAVTGGGGGAVTGGGGGAVTGGGGGAVTGGGGGAVTGGGGGAVTGGGGGATGGGGGAPDTAAQLTAVRAAADMGTGAVSLPVQSALVTFVKPLVPDAGVSDPAGFFVQAGSAGPALFVAVDPSTLPTAPGDLIDFTVTGVTRIGQVRVASSLSGFVKQSSGTPVSGLAQNVSSVDFAAAGAIDGFESELVSLNGTLAGDMLSAGGGYQSAALVTAGTTDAGVMKLRLPNAVADAEGLGTNCSVQFTAAPFWRFNAQAQPSTWSSTTLAGTSCPAPRLVGAVATSPSSVRAQFDRPMNPTSVSAATMSVSGLTVSTVTGSGMIYTLTTTPQTSGATYTLSATSAVADLRGTPINPAGQMRTFLGYQAPVSGLVINEVDYDNVGTDSAEFIELYNPGTATESLSGKSIVLINGGTTGTGPAYTTVDLTPGGSLAPGEFLVLANATVLATLPATVKKVTLSGTNDLIQNGPTDAVALIDTASAAIFDALSYEGVTSWTSPNGTVVVQEGAASTTGLADSNTAAGSLCRNPNGVDTNSNGTDFIFCTAATPGAVNTP